MKTESEILKLDVTPTLQGLRVLIVSEPGSGGVFRHVEGLIRFLLEVEVSVDLVYSSVRSCPELFEVKRLVEQCGGMTMDLRTGSSPAVPDTIAFVRLLQFVRRRKPSIIHAHSSKAGVLVRSMPLLAANTPRFYTPNAYYGTGRQGWSRALFNGIEAFLAPFARTINVSESEADYARVHAGVRRERQAVIPNGVEVSVFRPPVSDEKGAARRGLGIPTDAIVLGTVGRYSAQKDPVTLHSAVRRVLNRHPILGFVHVGEGELWADVDALGSPDPRVYRLKSFRPMADFYRAIDCFVLPSRYEGLSIAAIEAMATNLPMILSRAPGNLEFEPLGLNRVFWCETGNVESVEQAIETWLEASPDPPNHRCIATEAFDRRVILNRILNEYLTALGNVRRRN